jgi:hypothetical protein
MLILSLQWLLTLLFILFGIVAATVPRYEKSGSPRHLLLWSVAGITFILQGLNRLAQNTFGTWAYFAGPESRVFRSYLVALPAANHSRTFAMLAFCVVLGVLTFWRRELSRSLTLLLSVGLVMAGMGVGAVVGWYEGAFRVQPHFSAVAVSDAFELVFLLAALFAVLVANQVDRLLWLALTAYAFNVALNILWMVGLSALGVGWAPSVLHMNLYRVALLAIMVCTAVRRVYLARREIPTRGLLDTVPARGSALNVG